MKNKIWNFLKEVFTPFSRRNKRFFAISFFATGILLYLWSPIIGPLGFDSMFLKVLLIMSSVLLVLSMLPFYLAMLLGIGLFVYSIFSTIINIIFRTELFSVFEV